MKIYKITEALMEFKKDAKLRKNLKP